MSVAAQNVVNPWTSAPLVMDYFYELDIQTGGGGLAPGKSASGTLQINADSDFYWLSTMYEAVPIGGAPPGSASLNGDLSVQIENVINGRSYMNAPVPVNCIAGNANAVGTGTPHAFMLPEPIQYQARQSVLVNVFNSTFSVNTYASLKLTFIGLRVFL